MDLFAGLPDPSDPAPAPELLEGLNPRQKEAVVHEGGPLLVLAGAGSGKTRVLTRRVAYLVASRGVYPGNILAVTFTNKAAAEMRERIVDLVGPAARSAWLGTFHSIGARILRMEYQEAELSRDFSIFDRDDSLTAIRRVLTSMGIAPKEHPPETFMSMISKAKNEMQSPDQFASRARGPFERLAAQVYLSYHGSLRAQSAVDFDDLLIKPVELMRKEHVRDKWRRRFQHVLVDEYQDTNKCQYEFLRHLTEAHRQLLVVGDDDQSIYRWRGADLQNILNFEDDYPDAGTVRLEQNYRSTGRILAAANSVIRHNEGRKGKELWTENGEGTPVRIVETPDEHTEAMTVLRTIKQGIESEGDSPKDFAVLYRTNAQSRVLENTFQMGGVPYQIIGGQRFYDRKEIKDVLAFLRLIVNPDDNVAVQRVINVPPRGIGKKSLEDLLEDATAKGDALLAAMRRTVEGEGAQLRPAARESIRSFLGLIDRATQMAEVRPVEEVTEMILEDVRYEEYLEDEAQKQAYSRWENVTELLASMQEFTDTPEREDPSVAAFLQEVSLLTDADSADDDADTVTFMTLHNAKGLEFPRVFITGAEEGLFPHSNSIQEEEGIEEERRLFYVGITRAEQRLSILHAGSRRRWDGVSPAVPSRFLDEIDPDHVERVALQGASHSGPARYGGRTYGPRGSSAGGSGRGRGRSGTARSVSVDSWSGSQREDSRDYIPSYEDESQEASNVRVGMRVRHPSWGEGIVESIEGTGEQMKLTIKFRGGILKKVLAVYAKLQPLD